MTVSFSEYQTAARATAVYPAKNGITYCALGLCGESGEVADKIKKVIRDQDGEFTAENRVAIRAELGDILWYVAQLATELDIDLNDIATGNLTKLRDRQDRGVLGGSGDRR